jgi:hypothetical protein
MIRSPKPSPLTSPAALTEKPNGRQPSPLILKPLLPSSVERFSWKGFAEDHVAHSGKPESGWSDRNWHGSADDQVLSRRH